MHTDYIRFCNTDCFCDIFESWCFPREIPVTGSCLSFCIMLIRIHFFSPNESIYYSNKGRVIYYQLGGPVIFRGGRKFFWCGTGGVENKMAYEQGGGGFHVFRQVLGAQMCSIGLSFHLKVIASGGLCPPDPLYPSSLMWDFLNHWATLEIKHALFLLNKNLFLQMSPPSFSAFNNNHYHQC